MLRAVSKIASAKEQSPNRHDTNKIKNHGVPQSLPKNGQPTDDGRQPTHCGDCVRSAPGKAKVERLQCRPKDSQPQDKKGR